MLRLIVCRLVSGGILTWSTAAGLVLLFTLVISRTLELLFIGLALWRVRRGGRNKGLAAKLRECMDACREGSDGDAAVDPEVVKRNLRIHLPGVHARWCEDDPAISYLVCLAPVAGMLMTLSVLATDQRPTGLVGDAVLPTAVGLAISLAASLLALAIRLYNLPLRLRSAVAYRPARRATCTSVVLRAHSGPVIAVIFLTAYADLLTGLYVRERYQQQGEQQSSASGSVSGINKGNWGERLVYLELFARAPGQFELGGRLLPANVREREAAVRQIVIDHTPEGRTDGVIRIAVWVVPGITQGELLPLKACIQAAIGGLDKPTGETMIEFEDGLLCAPFAAGSMPGGTEGDKLTVTIE